jgi:hypothetical protein
MSCGPEHRLAQPRLDAAELLLQLTARIGSSAPNGSSISGTKSAARAAHADALSLSPDSPHGHHAA